MHLYLSTTSGAKHRRSTATRARADTVSSPGGGGGTPAVFASIAGGSLPLRSTRLLPLGGSAASRALASSWTRSCGHGKHMG